MLSKQKIVVILTPLILSALILSYEGTKNIESGIEARMECHGGTARVILENNGTPCRIYYLTVAEGDKLIKVLELNQILESGKKVLELDIASDKYKVSIVFDRGVIGGLSCNSSVRSQP